MSTDFLQKSDFFVTKRGGTTAVPSAAVICAYTFALQTYTKRSNPES